MERLVLPSDIENVFDGAFGWLELEEAARKIVQICQEKGNSFACCFRCSQMDSLQERDGFASLVAQGFLEQPDLEGRGGPALFCVNEAFLSKLNFQQNNSVQSHPPKNERRA